MEWKCLDRERVKRTCQRFQPTATTNALLTEIEEEDEEEEEEEKGRNP